MSAPARLPAGPRPVSSGPVASPVRVLICDDSATVRALIARLLGSDPGVRIVAQAANGQEAVAALARLPPADRPQIVLLDLEMPVMDGMTALPLLLRGPDPPAVIVASALTQRGAAAAMAALRAGAVDYVPKPGATSGGGQTGTAPHGGTAGGIALRPTPASLGGVAGGQAFRDELLAKIRGWARVAKVAPPVAAPPRVRLPATVGAARPPVAIGIGASTGGPQALARLVKLLRPAPPVPMLLVQHMPRGFTAMLADHLGRLGGPSVSEATDGEPLRAGHILVAPGDRHMLVEAGPDGALRARLADTPPENYCRPAVDPMLRTLVSASRGPVLAVILTGMGHDGLEGCRAVAAAGGSVLAQDEASSVVWGMPGAVARAGLPRLTAPPEALAEQMVAVFGRATRGAA